MISNVVSRFPFSEFLAEFQSPWSLTSESKDLQLDVKADDNKVLLVADVPGIKLEDVEIDVKDSVLTLRVSRKEQSETEQAKYFIKERRYGSSVRSFRLPNYVRTDEISANLKDGVLTITLPKIPESQPKRILIKSE